MLYSMLLLDERPVLIYPANQHFDYALFLRTAMPKEVSHLWYFVTFIIKAHQFFPKELACCTYLRNTLVVDRATFARTLGGRECFNRVSFRSNSYNRQTDKQMVLIMSSLQTKSIAILTTLTHMLIEKLIIIPTPERQHQFLSVQHT